MITINVRYPNIKSSCDVFVKASNEDVDKLQAIQTNLDACLFKTEHLEWLSHVFPWTSATFDITSQSFEHSKLGIASRSFSGDPKKLEAVITKWILISEQKFGKKKFVIE